MTYPPDVPAPTLDPSEVMRFATDGDRQWQAEQAMLTARLRELGYADPSLYVNVMRALAHQVQTIGQLEMDDDFARLVMGSDRRRWELLTAIAALEPNTCRDLMVWLAGLSPDRFTPVATAAQAYLQDEPR